MGSGFTFYLGFALPLAVASDLSKDPAYDARPMPGRCSFCKRQKEDTYRLGVDERICADDIVGVVHRSGARRIRPQPRGVEVWPLEKVAEFEHERVPLDPWWDRQFV